MQGIYHKEEILISEFSDLVERYVCETVIPRKKALERDKFRGVYFPNHIDAQQEREGNINVKYLGECIYHFRWNQHGFVEATLICNSKKYDYLVRNQDNLDGYLGYIDRLGFGDLDQCTYSFNKKLGDYCYLFSGKLKSEDYVDKLPI